MRHRPRWALLGLGALIVALLFTFPLWRKVFTSRSQNVLFALADPARRDVLLRMPDRDSAAKAYSAMLTPVPVPTQEQPGSIPRGAQVIVTTDFKKLDALRVAEGKVTMYRLIDDSILMRFSPFKVTNGPQLAVYLSASEDPRTVNDLGSIVPEFLVGPLKGNTGDQDYIIPKELPLARYNSVVIFSEGLQMVYSSAPLK
jgi:hypothetical protein